MAGIAPVKVDYKSASTNLTVRSMGGVADGHVTVDGNNGPRIAQPVMNDINNGIAENPGDDSYKNLQTWSENDRTEYQYDAYEKGHEQKINDGRDSVKTSDGDTATDADKDSRKGAAITGLAAAGAAGAGAATTVIAALGVAEGNKDAAKSAEKASPVPYAAPVVGAIFLALGLVSLAMAIWFDKDLKLRENFSNAVATFEKQSKDDEKAIEELYESTIADRTSRYEDLTSIMSSDTQDYLDKLEELSNKIQELTEKGASQEEIQALKDELNQLIEDDELYGNLDKMSDVADESYDDFYGLLAEGNGKLLAYDTIAKFLRQGHDFGRIAAIIASLDMAIGGLGTYMIIKMWSAVAGIDAPARAVAAVVGASLVTAGTAIFFAAGGTMFKRMAQEYKCGKNGDKLAKEVMTKLKESIDNHMDLDEILNTEYEAAFQNAEAVAIETYTAGQETTNNNENGGGDGGNNGGDGGGNGGGDTGGGGGNAGGGSAE